MTSVRPALQDRFSALQDSRSGYHEKYAGTLSERGSRSADEQTAILAEK
jgi:hypothetical protein